MKNGVKCYNKFLSKGPPQKINCNQQLLFTLLAYQRFNYNNDHCHLTCHLSYSWVLKLVGQPCPVSILTLELKTNHI